jgi:isopropylmalate/homocitrate/citramalate synthase
LLADPDYLMLMYRTALCAGASVLSLSDSMGTAKPAAVRLIVERMRALSDTAGIRLHMHDDYGLALANTLAGIEAGADWVEASVNGLGERAGNAALEEVVVALEGLYGIDTGIRTEGLFDLCALVERISGVPIPPMKPVTGANTFTNKLEIHVKAAAADRSLMEPYDPALVGNRRMLKLGRGTGPTGVRLKAAELGIALRDEDVDRLVDLVNRRAVETKRSVTDDEFAELART